MPANSAYVGLAAPGDAGSWQRESKVWLTSFFYFLSFFEIVEFSLNCIVFICYLDLIRVTNFGPNLMKAANLPLGIFVLENTIFLHLCLVLLEIIDMMLKLLYPQVLSLLKFCTQFFL